MNDLGTLKLWVSLKRHNNKIAKDVYVDHHGVSMYDTVIPRFNETDKILLEVINKIEHLENQEH